MGDEQQLSSLAQNVSELAAVEGKGLLETARKFLDFAPGSLMPLLREQDNGQHESGSSESSQ